MTPPPLFTVLTPTFNRRHTLERVYRSLDAQAFRSFEWVVVDDGSSDGTEELVSRLATAARFPVRYVWQENGGKHVAFNRGVRESRGELVLTLDSDDALSDDALVRFDRAWREISEDQRAGFAGVTGLCVDADGRVIGERFKTSPLDSNSQSAVLLDRIRGEKFGFIRRDILLERPFPEHLPTKFIPEGRIWFEVGADFKTRFINEPVRIMYDGDHPRLSRLSRLNRLHGDYEYNFYSLNRFGSAFVGRAPLQILKLALLAVRSGLALGLPLGTILSQARTGTAKILILLAAPPAFLFYMSDMIGAYGELGLLSGLSRRLPRGGLFRPIANLFRRIYVRRQRPTIEMPVLDFRMALEPNECVDGQALFCPQMLDWKVIRFLESRTPVDGVFLDVGADSGFHSLRMSRRIPSGRVIAIEANPHRRDKLRRNIQLSLARNVTVLEGGGGDLESNPKPRLDEVLREIGIDRVDSMRMDIEGSECSQLRAFFESAAEPDWPIAVSIALAPATASNNGDALRLLAEKGYRQVGRAEHNFMLVRDAARAEECPNRNCRPEADRALGAAESRRR